MAYLDNVKTFVRVYDLRNMSAAARDLRISAAVASSRISQLEEHLGVRLFQRTTRQLNPTEQGNTFYKGATKILDAVQDAEADISNITSVPRGSLYIAAPLGLGQKIIAPCVPEFHAKYPHIHIRLRLSDRRLDLAAEGLDASFFLGVPEDSTLKLRKIMDCPRQLYAAPDYLAKHGEPETSADLKGKHACLNLRYPGAREFQWPLETSEGVKRVTVTGPFESDHGEVLTNWALKGHGIILKPMFEVLDHVTSGALVPVLENEPPTPIQLACLFMHRRMQDPKTRLFIDFMVKKIQDALAP